MTQPGVPLDPTNQPIFILGNRRSGTTMLRLMLAAHPRIGIPPEGGFLVQLGWAYGRSGLRTVAACDRFVHDLLAQETATDWHLDRDELRNDLSSGLPISFPDAVDIVYRQYLRRKFPGKQRWGDKTTWYLNWITMLDRFFPRAKFVHIVRDGRDVACSYRGVPHLDNLASRVALEWSANVRAIARAGHRLGPGRLIHIRYEDLVANPAGALQDLCGFLDEEFAEEMLMFWRLNREGRLEPERHMAWKELTRDPVTTARVGRWKEELDANSIRKFEAVAGHELEKFSYDLDSERLGTVTELGWRVRSLVHDGYWRGRRALRRVRSIARHHLRS